MDLQNGQTVAVQTVWLPPKPLRIFNWVFPRPAHGVVFASRLVCCFCLFVCLCVCVCVCAAECNGCGHLVPGGGFVRLFCVYLLCVAMPSGVIQAKTPEPQPGWQKSRSPKAPFQRIPESPGVKQHQDAGVNSIKTPGPPEA